MIQINVRKDNERRNQKWQERWSKNKTLKEKGGEEYKMMDRKMSYISMEHSEDEEVPIERNTLDKVVKTELIYNLDKDTNKMNMNNYLDILTPEDKEKFIRIRTKISETKYVYIS